MFGHYNKRSKQTINPRSSDYPYSVTGKGLKLRAHPLAIRIAYEMFKNLDKINLIKQRMVSIIESNVNSIDGLTLNMPYSDSKCSYYALIIKYDAKKFNNLPIKKFVEALNAEGGIEFDIPTSTCPLDRFDLFKTPKYFFSKYEDFVYGKNEFDGANKFYENSFKMPVWYDEEDLDIVLNYCKILKKVSNYYKENKN